MPLLPTSKTSLSALLLPLFCLIFTSAAAPAIATNFPDPCLAQSKSGQWFAFSTQTGNINIQMASSSNFDSWILHEGDDALPNLPAWTVAAPNAKVWAPDVNPMPNGQGWIMYFAAVGTTHPLVHCIGTATSPNITGPYTPNPEPLICDLTNGGNIDPNLFYDPVNSNYYLVYKTDGNSIGHGGACGNTAAPVAPTPIMLQQLSPKDLVTKIGIPVPLISNMNPTGSFQFDGPNTERPSIAFRDNTYFLLYNSQCYAETSYRIKYVSCTAGVDTTGGITGCNWSALKAVQQPTQDRILLQTNNVVGGSTLYAPGSMDTSADSSKMVFHADANLDWFEPNHMVDGQVVTRERGMYAAQISFDSQTGNLGIA